MKEIQRIVALNLSMNGQSVDFEKSFIQIGKYMHWRLTVKQTKTGAHSNQEWKKRTLECEGSHVKRSRIKITSTMENNFLTREHLLFQTC